MKKIKVLTGLVGLTGLSMGLIPTIAGCGCTNNSYKVEMTSKLKEKEFSNLSGGISYTFKVADEATAKATKVQMANLKVDGAVTPTVSGLVTRSYDSAGNIKVIVKTNTLISQWPNGTKFEFSLLFTNKENNKTTTFDGFVLTGVESSKTELQKVEFESCDWSIITQRADTLYAKRISEEEFIKSFYVDSDQKEGSSFDDFVGLEREITINTVAHKVRVIGIKHDTIAAGETYAGEAAVFTFELITLLSNKTGNGLRSMWDASKNFDYTNSILRWNINGQGSGVKPEDVWDTPAINMLQTEVQSKIKSVNKIVATSSDSGTTFSATTYKDKLFPLSCDEMGTSNHLYDVKEGTTYTYWENHKDVVDRKKFDAARAVASYLLVSPLTTQKTYSYYINAGGKFSYLPVNRMFNVSFAFCI